MRTGFVIFLYSLIFTSLVSFFAVMIILGRHLVLPSSADQDLTRRLLRTLPQRNARSTLREGDVYAIALRHLEEGLRSRNPEVLAGIERETSFCENAPGKS